MNIDIILSVDKRCYLVSKSQVHFIIYALKIGIHASRVINPISCLFSVGFMTESLDTAYTLFSYQTDLQSSLMAIGFTGLSVYFSFSSTSNLII